MNFSSIDERLQTVTEDADNCAVIWSKRNPALPVMINIPAGEILSMASCRISANNLKAHRGTFSLTARLAILEPGSTVKPLVIMTALQPGHRAAGQRYRYPSFTLDGHRIATSVTIRNGNRHFAKSSDTGVSHLSLACRCRVMDTYKALVSACY